MGEAFPEIGIADGGHFFVSFPSSLFLRRMGGGEGACYIKYAWVDEYQRQECGGVDIENYETFHIPVVSWALEV